MNYNEIDTFEPLLERGMDPDRGGIGSSCKIPGDATVVRVDKGFWSNQKQDWFARLTFSNGVVINSATMFGEY